MRVVKVKVKISPNPGGGTKYTYPPEYWDCLLQPLVYESEGDLPSVKTRKAANNWTEFILCVCPDDSHVITNPDFEVITPAQGNVLGKKWTAPDPKTGLVVFDINKHV